MSSPVVLPESTCPACGTAGTGRFCTECGTPLNGAPCAGCGEPLSAGAKFCHRCGLKGGQAAAAGQVEAGKNGNTLATTLPWAVAGIAFLALFAMLAGKGFNSRRGSSLDAPSNALPNPELDGPMARSAGAGPMMDGGASSGGASRAPDISKMDPAELASRLFNRVMLLNTQGKSDSVQFFAPMAIQAYQMVQDKQGHGWDLDQRFDVGRIAEAAGALPMAKAQADTILQKEPNHLLGLLLAANVAKKSGNTPAFQTYSKQFNEAKTRELARKLPEYEKHASDISTGL